MDLRIPGNLSGNAGDSVGGEMAATGVTVGRIGEIFDTIQANFDYNDASALKYQSDLEKQDYHVKFWLGEDGSDPESMKRYNEGLGKIDQNYIDRAYKVNNRVGGYVQKDAAAVSANLTQEAHKVYYNKFLNKSIETDKNETDRATKRAIMTGEFGLELQNNMVRLESRRPIYGDNVDGVIADANAYMAENFIRGRLANQTTAAEFLKRVQDNPEYKQNLYQHLPSNKIDDMEKLLKESNDKVVGTAAFQDTLNVASQLPEVTEGKVSQLDAAEKLWADPETIKKYGISDDVWREGFLNFNVAINVRDKQDEKLASQNALGLEDKFNAHTLKYDDVKTAFAGLQNPVLKLKSIDFWDNKLDNLVRQDRAEKREMRTQARWEEQQTRALQTDNANVLMADPEMLKNADLGKLLATGQISGTHFKTLSAMKDKLDPLKSEQAKRAIKMLSDARTSGLFNPSDKLDNEKKWSDYSDILHRYIQNHPDDDPAQFVKEQIFEPAAVGMVGHLLDIVSPGQPGTDTAKKNKLESLNIMAGDKKKGNVVKKTYSQADLEYTARKYNITVEEVKKRLGFE